jgi:hypothetical protein
MSKDEREEYEQLRDQFERVWVNAGLDRDGYFDVFLLVRLARQPIKISLFLRMYLDETHGDGQTPLSKQ